MNNKEEVYGGGIVESVINSILAKYNITPDDIAKVKSIVDKVEVTDSEDSTTIEINLKKLKITIEK